MMGSMGRKNRLFDIEIDEISAVDRPANQHGLISIAKALGDDTEEGGMPVITDEAGNPVSEDELEFGDVVVDENGESWVWSPADESEGVEEREPELVGKANPLQLLDEARAGWAAGRKGLTTPAANTRTARAATWLGKNPKKTVAGAAGAAGVAGGGAYLMGEAKKSLGDQVLESLSKAATEDEREQIVAKALDTIEVLQAQNEELSKAFEAAEDARVTEAYISKAAEYNLPVSPAVLGPILKAVAEVLSDEELDVLDQLFTSVGDTLYTELGFSGGASNSGILDEVSGLAAEVVGKSAGSVSFEQANVALFEANPAAYDAYIAEQNGR